MVLNLNNGFLIQYGKNTNVTAGSPTVTITFPTSFAGNYSFATSGDSLKPTVKNITTITAKFAWGVGNTSYQELYWIALGF